VRKSPASAKCMREYLCATPTAPSAPYLGTGSLGSLLRFWFQNFSPDVARPAVEAAVVSRSAGGLARWPLRQPNTYCYVTLARPHL
jgi:hypothetical protein